MGGRLKVQRDGVGWSLFLMEIETGIYKWKMDICRDCDVMYRNYRIFFVLTNSPIDRRLLESQWRVEIKMLMMWGWQQRANCMHISKGKRI